MRLICSPRAAECRRPPGVMLSTGASILFVDDDPQIVRALVPALEVSGIRVTVATCGVAAMRHCKDSQWQAAVVDLGLPDMDGQDLVRHLAGECDTPVIVISAQHSRTQVEVASECGAIEFLHKPFRTPDLIRRLHELIGGSLNVPNLNTL